MTDAARVTLWCDVFALGALGASGCAQSTSVATVVPVGDATGASSVDTRFALDIGPPRKPRPAGGH